MARIALLLGLLLAAVTSFAQTNPFDITYRTYKTGQHSNEKSFKTYVIRSQMEWEDYWYKTTGNPRRTAPTDVNWGDTELLAIHLGERPTGGYSVYVDNIDTNDSTNFRVHLIESRPPKGRMVTQALSSPYTIISLPKRWATYQFSREVVDESPNNPDPRPRPQPCNCNCPCCSGKGQGGGG